MRYSPSKYLPLLSFVILFISVLSLSALTWTALHYYRLLYMTKLDPLGLDSIQRRLHSFPHQNSSRNITFIGDSRARSWPTPSSLNSYSFLNLGVSGHTTSQVLLLFSHLLQSPFKPNIVVIQVGINDLKTLPLFPTKRQSILDLCQTNIHNLVSLSRKSGALVVVTTIMPVGHIPLFRRPLWSQDIYSAIDDCNQSIRSLKSDGVFILETSSILTGPNGRVLPNYQLNFLHINDLGYRALNTELIPLLHLLTSKSLTPN